MTREEALDILMSANVWNDEERTALGTLLPEFRMSEDERIRKELIEYHKQQFEKNRDQEVGLFHNAAIAYLEKQKVFSNGEGLYYYRPDGDCTFIGTGELKPIEDIKINGKRPKTENKGVDLPDSVKINGIGVMTESEDERIRKDIIKTISWIVPDCQYAIVLPREQKNEWLAYLEKQKEEEGYEAIPVESTLEYKLGFKAGKESEKQKDLTTENIYKHSRERMSFYNGQQKEQKPVSNPKWAELTWKDINELERIINNVHYEFQNGIGEDSFGELVLERFKEYKDDGSMDEQKPAECERQPEFKEVEYDFRGEKVKVMRPFFRDDKGREFSTTGQDTDLTWSVLREWCEIKGITPFDLYPRAEWSEEDEEMRKLLIAILEVNHPDGFFKANELGTTDMRGVHTEEIISWLKSLRPSWKPSEEQMSALLAIFNDPNNIGSQTCQLALTDLYEQLKKL